MFTMNKLLLDLKKLSGEPVESPTGDGRREVRWQMAECSTYCYSTFYFMKVTITVIL